MCDPLRCLPCRAVPCCAVLCHGPGLLRKWCPSAAHCPSGRRLFQVLARPVAVNLSIPSSLRRIAVMLQGDAAVMEQCDSRVGRRDGCRVGRQVLCRGGLVAEGRHRALVSLSAKRQARM
jgi:hypothetical protein